MSKEFPAEDTLVESGSRLTSASNILIKCGDCLHFSGSPHPAKGQACTQMGVKKFANAPSCYTANVHVFRKTSPQAFAQLSNLISSFSATESRVLMGLLKQQTRLDRRGLTFLERVYFKLGQDYLDNYVCGFALGVGPSDEILIVGASYFSNQRSSIVASLDQQSVIKEKDFLRIQERLTDSGRLYEPRKPHRNEDVGASAYVPPTFETSPDYLEKLAKDTSKRRKPKREPSEGRVLEVDLSNL